ncbi:MAG: hypothetical protein ACRD0U_06235 [Acidimicrobiales bacterium]
MNLARTAEELRSFRLAATLLAVLPGAVLETASGDDPEWKTIGPACRIRAVIAEALEARTPELVTDRLGLPVAAPLRLAAGAGGGDARDLGGGVYALVSSDATRALFATTLAPCRAKAAVVAVTRPGVPDHLVVDIDPCTAVSLVVCASPPHPAAGRRLAEFALDAAGACLAEELICGL